MKKNWNVAKIFTLLITVLFLASTLFVGCKEQEPEPEPTVPTKYMVTYVTNPEGLQVEDFPTMGEVEENKTIELPTLTLEGYTFDGWYDGDTKVESPYKVTKAVTLTAKFTKIVPVPTKYMVTYVTNPEGLQVENFPTTGEVEENKTIELPTLTLEGYTFDGWYGGDTKVESPYKVTKAVTLTAKFTKIVPVPDTTNNFKGNYYAGKYGDTDFGYIEFTTETDCVVNVEIEVYATYTVADNVATIKGVDYSEIEIKTTALANDSFSVTYPVEICQRFDPDASENMVITYTKTDKPSSEGGEGGVESDPETPETPADPKDPVVDTTNNFEGNYYAGADDMGYIEFTTETDCVVNVEIEVYATYTVADNVATIKGVDYSEIEIKTTPLANDSFSVTYPVEICKMFNPYASEDMVITYTKVDNPSSEGGEAVLKPDPDPELDPDPIVPEPEPQGTTYTISEIDPSWTNIVVYAWSEGVDPVILQATNNSGTVTFKSTVEYEKVIVVKINDSVDTNNVVIDEGSEFHVWKENDVKVDQTGNLELGENNIYEVPVVSKYTIYLSPGERWPEAGAWFIAWTYGGEKTADEWIKFTDLDEDGIYEAEIYEDKTTMILLRKDPSVTSIDWNGEWARIETSIGGNCFTIVGWNDSNSWSTYTPE